MESASAIAQADFENEEKYSFEDQMLDALKEDRYTEFIQLLENGTIRKIRKMKKAHLVSKLLSWMLQYKAIVCCNYFLHLAPRNGLTINLNVPLADEYDGLFPLHVAAVTPPFHFVGSFLRYGARTDVVCNNSSSRYYLMLPIEAALSTLRENISWDLSQSIYQLLLPLSEEKYEFDGLFTAINLLKESAEVQQKQEVIQEVICRCVRGEKMVELAALLFADATSNPDHYIGLSNEVFMKLRTSFSTELASLMEGDVKDVENRNGNGKLSATMKRKRSTLTIAMQLLEFFYRANLSVLGLGNRQENLASRMVDAGFHLTTDDLPNLDNILAQNKHGTSILSKPDICKDIQPFYLQPRALFQTAPIKVQINPVNQLLNSHFADFGKRGLSSAVQAFHASPRLESKFRIPLFSPVDAQSQLRKAAHANDLRIVNPSFCKKWSHFVAAVRKIMHA